MSDENVELLRRWIEAFNAREIDAMIAHCDPSIELHSVFAAAGGAVYSGHDGLRRWQRDLEDAWGEGIRVEPEASTSTSASGRSSSTCCMGAGSTVGWRSRCRLPPCSGGATA